MLFKNKVSALRVGAVVVIALGLAMLSRGWACPFHSSNRAGSGEPAAAEAPLAAPARERSAGSAAALVGAPASAAPDNAPAAVAQAKSEPQVIRSALSPYGYPNITVEAGRPVKWIIDAPPGSINGCNYRFVIREYGIRYELRPGENILEFTPNREGKVPYSCWMGMIPGTITVVKDSKG